MQIIIISGLSGSGKSIALNVVEDAGFYCVDNLPSLLLEPLITQLREHNYTKIAVVIDIRGGDSIDILPAQIAALRQKGQKVALLFLDANNESLIKRYSESRRKHPLAEATKTLAESINEERARLADLVELSHHLDTSDLKPNVLRQWVRQFTQSDTKKPITLLFQSFGFKHGVPLDAQLVFDVRCLLNPFYEPNLRALTGLDAPVIAFLEAEKNVHKMREDIAQFIKNWLPSYIGDDRGYLTVGIGCTGGQHRSVYIAKSLSEQFAKDANVLVRHRELFSG